MTECILAAAAPLPHGWKPCKDMVNNEVYYFNFNTGESIWDHPCDTKYRDIYLEEKAKKTQKLAKAQVLDCCAEHVVWLP